LTEVALPVDGKALRRGLEGFRRSWRRGIRQDKGVLESGRGRAATFLERGEGERRGIALASRSSVCDLAEKNGAFDLHS